MGVLFRVAQQDGRLHEHCFLVRRLEWWVQHLSLRPPASNVRLPLILGELRPMWRALMARLLRPLRARSLAILPGCRLSIFIPLARVGAVSPGLMLEEPCVLGRDRREL